MNSNCYRPTLHTLLLCLGMITGICRAQPFDKGTPSPNFTLPNRNGEPVHLTDYTGHVIVLDFFAYWCAPCSVSSPDIEKNIQKHYEDAGGNPHGVPVQVISVNLEAESPESTDTFIEQADLDLVINDFDQEAWNLYNLLGSRPSIPLFVIINGVVDSPTHQPWEVLHSQHGMYLLSRQTSAKAFQTVINSVQSRPNIEEPKPNPFQELPLSPGGWKLSEWFGSLNDRFYPWIFHEELGWQFVKPSGENGDPLYFYSPSHGWRFTSPDEFPNAYDFKRSSWLQFDLTDTQSTPSFFDFNLQEWIDPIPSESERN